MTDQPPAHLPQEKSPITLRNTKQKTPNTKQKTHNRPHPATSMDNCAVFFTSGLRTRFRRWVFTVRRLRYNLPAISEGGEVFGEKHGKFLFVAAMQAKLNKGYRAPGALPIQMFTPTDIRY
jgi:hypothetical protein